MSHTVKDAKNNLSSLIRLAEKGEPQIIRRNDREVAVVVSIEDWKKLKAEKPSLVELLRSSPLVGEELDLSRQSDPPREFGFGE
ncbi:MAG TPA: type II toxin-antitoxin system Phd/YefM family antitoxin [Pyrinomonadaceae bacterium]|nr:type II toxin-antitoxin system Phd/YefM family antitoxin [Pyrinomonadaceae bacterium]